MITDNNLKENRRQVLLLIILFIESGNDAYIDYIKTLISSQI